MESNASVKRHPVGYRLFIGICLILIGVATGVDAFTTSVAAKIAYVVILFVILAVFLFVLRTKCIKK